jgi:hypothetical protein
MLALVLLIMALAVPTPAASATTSPDPNSLSTGWMSETATDVVYLSWTLDGGSISGVVYWSYLPYPGSHQPASTSGTLSGTASSGALTLRLLTDRGLETWQATVAGDTLTASFPGDSGLVGVLEFRPASIADYNAAVTAFLDREARLWQAEWERQQAQLADARRTATSCSMTVYRHDATLVVEGAEGVVDECLELAERSGIAEGWYDVVYPVGSVDGNVVCAGILDGYDVGVFDTGFAEWGAAICGALHPIPHVQDASAALRESVSTLRRELADVTDSAAAVKAAVRDVRHAVDKMHDAFGALVRQTKVRPMDSEQKGNVRLALEDVALAREDVTLALEDVGFAMDEYRASLREFRGSRDTAESALALLESSVSAEPDVTPEYAVAIGRAALDKAASRASRAADTVAKARASAASLRQQADELLRDAGRSARAATR